MKVGRDIPPLTGIRGIAALWVVVYHVHEFDRISGPGAVLIRHGYLAVDIFFVLSGFVMALSYRGLFEAGLSLRRYAVFLLRRAARIYPLYLLITLILIAPQLAHSSSPQAVHFLLKRLALNLALIESWGFGAPIVGPSWSISTELAAYLVFPFLAYLTIYGRSRLAVLATVTAILAIILITLVPTPPSYFYPRQGPLDISWQGTVWPLVRCIAEFTLGLAAYGFATGSMALSVLTRSWVTSTVTAAMIVLLCIKGTDILIVCLVPVFLLTITSVNSLVPRLLASQPVMLLGRLSYAIYLLHFPLLPTRQLVRSHLPAYLNPLLSDVVALAVFYGLLVVLAALSYRLIEVPGRQVIRAVERRLFPQEDRALVVSEDRGLRGVTRGSP